MPGQKQGGGGTVTRPTPSVPIVAPNKPGKPSEPGVGGVIGAYTSLPQLAGALSAFFLPSSLVTPPLAKGTSGNRITLQQVVPGSQQFLIAAYQTGFSAAPKLVVGTVTVTGAGTTTVTFTGAEVFSSATSYGVYVWDTIALARPAVTAQAAGSFAFTSAAGTHPYVYMCFGL